MRSNDKWMEDAFESIFPEKKPTPPTQSEQLANEFLKFFPQKPTPTPEIDIESEFDKFFSTHVKLKKQLANAEDFQRKAVNNAIWKEAFDAARTVRETALANAKKALQDASFSQKGDPRKTCGLCGGYLSIIRGRYPKSDNRVVCPTCLADRMENINEISGKNYGVASQNK